MKTIEDKVAVVTGGASGIGYALASRLLQGGSSVVVADIEDIALQAAVGQLQTEARPGRSVIGIRTDVRVESSVQALADRTLDEFGRVDIVCNNAGVETGGRFLDIDAAAWRWVMEVNFFGVLNGCRTFLPLLLERDEAHIVNTASVAAFSSGAPFMAPYCASKMAIDGLSECLDSELRTLGKPVRVSLLAPGMVKTNMIDAERNAPEGLLLNEDPERRAAMEAFRVRHDEEGLDALDVADQVIDAIRTERFFVLPHADQALRGIRTRLNWMETGEPPKPRIAGG
ncbi:SDR family NAD(P)-dependent oxidoreductase [Rhodococcus sp. NPDC057529]|uniref:SDR family NAD(P)-dependent oxidoreductase n=1 Tax=Rhodococcus sp. NPDC057529 TaxID=3346158 RepID=UPI00366F26C3